MTLFRGASRAKKALLGVAITLLAAVVGLFGFEAFLGSQRDLVEGERYVRSIRLREWPPATTYMPVPGRTWLFDSLESRPYRVKVDPNGFLEPSRVYDDPDRVLVFLGGSTTECMFVSEELRFPSLVGKLLEPTVGKVNSYNAGRAGNNTLHSMNILLNKVIPMEPDAVVMMHNWNDLSVLMYHETTWTTKIPGRNTIVVERKHKGPRDLAREVVQNLFPNILARLTQPGAAFDEFNELKGTGIVVDADFIHDELRKSLETFVGICQARGIRPVLMTQANRLKAEPDELVRNAVKKVEAQFVIDYAGYRDLYESCNQVIRDVGRDRGVLVIDLAARVPQEREYMYDMCHFNDHGSQYVAEIIAEDLGAVL